MSDERLVMALLTEGNPATEVVEDASTRVPAATYLATLEQRSSDMTKTDESAKTPAPGPRRRVAWALAAFAVVLTLGGLYLAFNGDDGQVVDQTTMPTPTPTTVLEPEPATTNVPEAVKLTGALPVDLEPGTYWIDHDADSATSLRVEFTLAEPGWGPFVGVNKSGPTDASGYVAAKFLAVETVASAACNGTVWVSAGDTAEDLAIGLSKIEDFVAKEPLEAVSAYGYDGYHLVLEVTDLGFEVGAEFVGCDDGYFDGYEGPTISRWYQAPDQVVEFWALDVNGTPLLIETTWFPDTPAEDLDQLQAILDSVVITP